MRARSHRTITGSVAVLLALALVAGACDSGGTPGGDPESDDTRDDDAVTLFSERGPYTAGVTTLDLSDRQVEVWYPADPAGTEGVDEAVYYIRDSIPETIQAIIPEDINPPYVSEAHRDVLPADDGPFPLVLFSHGFGGFSTTSTAITDHLASWGFVVASTDHLERGLESQFGVDVGSDKSDTEVLREVVDLVSAENERSDSILEGVVSTDKIAVTGHSAGGSAAIAFAAEDDVATYMPMAASGEGDDEFPSLDTPDKPSLYLAGAIDTIIEPAWTRATFDRAPGPKRLVVIDDVGHLNAFTEICEIGTEGGGVVAIARDLGLPVPESLLALGEDGCQEEALDSELGWDVTNHFLVAQLREAFGLEEPGTGFEEGIENAFESVTLTLDEEN